jgi:hypothetical protein
MMRGGRGVAPLLLLVVLFTSSACGIEPIDNRASYPIPAPAQKLTMEEIGHNIILAGVRHHWKITAQSPGHLKAVQDAGERMATISITYTRTAYSFTLESSAELDQNGTMISHRYNNWIHYLERDIDSQLIAAATAAGIGR